MLAINKLNVHPHGFRFVFNAKFYIFQAAAL